MLKCSINEQQEIVFHVSYYEKDRAKELGALWDKDRKLWSRPLKRMRLASREKKQYIKFLEEGGFELDEGSLNELDKFLDDYQGRINSLENEKRNFEAPQPDGIAIELRPYQKAGVAFLEKHKAAILADEMGVGKTYQGIGWARKKTPCLVVCPAVAKIHWMREIKKCRPNDRVLLGTGKELFENGEAINPELCGPFEWVVINYDILGNWLSWLMEQKIQSMMIDEAHKIKNPKSLRSTHCLLLAPSMNNKLCITGTPVMNRPLELLPLLQFLGKLSKKDTWWWRNRYCKWDQIPVTKWVTEDGERVRKTFKVQKYKGTQNLDELHEELLPYFLRRLKKEVQTDLPPKIFEEVEIELSNQEEYEKAEANVIQWITTNRGQEKASAAVRAEHLVRLNVLRQLAADGKVDQLLSILEDLEESGKKAVIFSDYKTNLISLHKKFKNSVLLVGGMSMDERQESIDRFQNDGDVNFFFTTIKAGGEAITLTAGDTVVFLDLPWTPTAKAQAEDRCHRHGQTSTVNVIHLLSKDSVDMDMWKLLKRKQVIIDQIVDGKVTETEEEESIMEVSRNILERVKKNL